MCSFRLVGEPLPPEAEARLSRLIAQAGSQLKQQHVAEAEAAEAEEMRKDPAWQQRERDLDIKEMQVTADIDDKRDKRAIELAKTVGKEIVDIMRIESEESRAGAKMGIDLMTWGKELEAKEREQGIEYGKEIADNIRKDEIEEKKMEQDRELRGKGTPQKAR